MLRVGLTGGIGSGKSTVAELFKKLGVSIIDADEIAHNITEPNTYSFESIVEHFGKAVVKDKMLDRRALRDIIFNNLKERQWLENLLHPVIREAMKERIIKVDTPYCMLVIPLLAESNKIDFIDRVCVVDVPETLQIKRATQRDRASESDAKAILASQCSREKRLAIADDIIHNDGDLENLKDQVLTLHKKYLSLSEKT